MGDVGDYWREHKKYKERKTPTSHYGDANHCLQCGEWHGFNLRCELCSEECKKAFTDKMEAKAKAEKEREKQRRKAARNVGALPGSEK